MHKTELKTLRAMYRGEEAPTADELAEYNSERVHLKIPGESEYQHQARLHSWLRKLGMLHFAPANEGKRTEAETRRLTAVGFTSGVLDVWILEPRQPYHGLILELKTERGMVSGAQEYWLRELSQRSYKAVVSWSFEESVKLVEDYLALSSWDLSCASTGAP